MEAHAKTIRQVLESSAQYLIPFFQRSYSWRKPQWERLWYDVLNLLDSGANDRHFIGPLVCTNAKSVPGEVPKYLLIDGQQRLTTLTVLLSALRDLLEDQQDSKSAARIHQGYLVHPLEEGLDHYRIVPRIGDRETLIAIIDGKVEKEHRRSHVYKAWHHFRKCIELDVAGHDAPAERMANVLNVATDRLSLVVITIDGENPYEIFESLNSTGLPLEESDLIRNYLFMQVPLDQQDKFNVSHWSKFEELFEGRDAEAARRATTFYRHWLMRNGVYSKAKSTFVDFKRQSRDRNTAPEEQVTELTRFAKLDRVIEGAADSDDKSVQRALNQIRFLDITTARPLILHLYDRHDTGQLPADEFAGCLDDLASFVLRRSICSESTRSYGQWFVKAIECIGDSPRDDLQKVWFDRGWPDDAHVVDRLRTLPIYSREQRKLRLILETLEAAHEHKEAPDLSKLTIEHVMPQTIGSNKDGKAWQATLGENWKETHRAYLHTLGNLTLTGYNPKLSNKPYAWKQCEFANSHVVMNRHFKKVRTWNGKAILKRTEQLAAQVASHWKRPAGGPQYIPSPEFSENLQEFCTAYWSAFVDVLGESGFDKSMDTQLSDLFHWIKGPRKCFRYFAEINTEEHYIEAGIFTSGKNANKYLQLLWESVSDEEQEAIEEAVDSDLYWSENACFAERLDVDLQDRSQWKNQHIWIVECIRTLDERLAPVITEVAIGDHQPELERDFEQWNAEAYEVETSGTQVISSMADDDDVDIE